MKKPGLLCLLLAVVLTAGAAIYPVTATEPGTDTGVQETTAPPDINIPAVPVGTDASVTSGCHSVDAKVPLLGSSDRMDYARSAILYEVNSDTLMYAWNPDERMVPASLVKIMTALLALEQGSMESPVTVSASAISNLPNDSVSVNLKAGEILTLEQLMYCMMVTSANDASAVIAEHIGGSQEAFVALMNKRAAELGCTGTHFTNPHGLANPEQYTTARDVTRILREALRHSKFKEIFETAKYTVEKTNLHGERNLTTTNNMQLEERGDYDYRVSGGRTGANSTTDRCFAGTSEENGLYYITVVMGADSTYKEDGYSLIVNGSFADTVELLDMGYQGCSTSQVLFAGQAMTQYPVINGENAVVAGVDQSCTAVLPRGVTSEDLTWRYASTDPQLTAPVEKGQRLTYIQVWYGSVCVAQSSLSALNGVAVSAADQTQPGTDVVEENGGLGVGLAVLGVLLAIIGGFAVINYAVKMVRRAREQSRRRKRRRNRQRSR